MSTQITSQKFEFVKASEIWPNAEDFEDKGQQPGLLRGYNPEIVTKDGKIDFMSCIYIDGEPEEYFYGEFYQSYLNNYGFKLTGRICFRGYGYEDYDPNEPDTYIVPINV